MILDTLTPWKDHRLNMSLAALLLAAACLIGVPPVSAGDGGATSAPARVIRYGPIMPSDTLWQIARTVRPDEIRITVPQTMVALFRYNPKAFNQNMNRMYADVTLKIPPAEYMQQISAQDARNLLNVHNKDAASN